MGKKNKVAKIESSQKEVIIRPQIDISDWKYLLVVALVTVVVFLPSLQNQFVNWDDQAYLTKNQVIKKPPFSNLDEIFTYRINNFAVPLTLLSFQIEHYFFGLNPKPYHVNNLILHLLNVVLVYFFIKNIVNQNLKSNLQPQTANYQPFIVALLFGIHPMNVESVAWVTERKDLLYTFFALLSLFFYTRSSTHEEQEIQNKKHITRNYIACFSFFVLSLLSKPQAIFLPFLLLLIDYFQSTSLQAILNFRKQIWKIPFFVVSLLAGIYIFQNVGTQVLELLPKYTFFERILFSFYQLGIYLFKFFFPIRLCGYYAYPMSGAIPFYYYLVPLGLVGAGVFVYQTMRTHRVVVFGVLFYLLNIFIFFQVFSTNTSLAFERFNYLAYIGLFFLVAYFLTRYATSWQPTWVVFMIYVCLLCVQTFQRCKVWQDDKTLFSDMIAKNATDVEMQKMSAKTLGEYAVKRNDFGEAITQYTKLIALDPTYVESYFGRGFAYSNTGNLLSAVQDFSDVLKLKLTTNQKVDALFNRGTCLLDLKQYQAAIADYSAVIQLVPNVPNVYQNRALCYESLKMYAPAIADYQQVIRLGAGSSAINSRVQKLQNLLNQAL